MEAWQRGSPDEKTELVSKISQLLLGISRDEAQALSPHDTPSPSLSEKISSMLHRNKRRWANLSSSARNSNNTSPQTSIRRRDSGTTGNNTSDLQP